MFVQLVFGDLERGGLYRARELGIQVAELVVDPGRGQLDQAKRAGELRGNGSARDREVDDSPLCRGAPERVRRHLHLSHRVFFNSVIAHLRSVWNVRVQQTQII